MDYSDMYGSDFGNIFTDISSDKDYDIINSYNFVLRVEALFNVAVRAVRGINKQNEYEYIQEGGLNDYVHMRRKQASQPFTFQVERYVSQDITEDFIDPLANGTELTLPLILYIYRGAKKDGKLPVRYYIFTNARVAGTQIGDLDAEKSGLHTITNTIAYSSLITFTLPWGTTDTDNIFKFDKNNTTPVNARTLKDFGVEHQDPDTSNMTEEEKKDTYKINLKSAEANVRQVRTKAEMEALAKKNKATRAKAYEEYWKDKKKKAADIEALRREELEEKGITVTDKYIYNEGPTEHVVLPDNQTGAEAETKAKMKTKAEKFVYQKTDPTPTGKANVQKNQPSKAEMEENAIGFTPDSPLGQLTKDEMEAKAIKFTPDSPAGQLSKKDMEANAKKITPDSPKGQLSKKEMEGKAKKITPVSPKGQLSKNQMKGKAIKYKYGDAPGKNIKVPEKQLSKSQMAGKASKYPPKRSAKDVKEFLKGRGGK